MLFEAGYYFGRNRNAGQQLLAAGQQLLDAETGQPVAQTVLLDTTIVSPEQANKCPAGYTWWPQYQKCLDPRTDAELRRKYDAGEKLP
jgi:hypothetical protein